MADTNNTPAAPAALTFRCAGCGQHRAPERFYLCTPCADSRPEEDNDEAAGDVGFESGDFY